MSTTTRGKVISAPSGRLVILMAAGVGALLATVFLILYVVWPERMGPTPERPTADTLTEVAVFAVVAWSIVALLWVVIDREVVMFEDHIIVIRGTGRSAKIFRNEVKGVHSFPVKKWFLMWVSFNRGAEIGRSIFFSLSASLPAWPHPR